MKLIWKLFCSMIIITTLACSVSGYFLIDQQFRITLEREVASVYEENDMLRYTLAREIEKNLIINQSELPALVDNITITTSRGTMPFSISDETGKRIAGNGTIPLKSNTLIAELPEGCRGWELVKSQDSRVYLHSASPLTLVGDTLYLENYREVTSLFHTRSDQYQYFLYLLVGTIAAVGLITLLVTSMMLQPLKRLSSATKRMASGRLHQRVKIESNDELGKLSEDFNVMAARLEAQVQELKDAAKRQEDFIGSFAHEIKTPLTSMIGYADLLRSRPLSPEQIQDSAGYIFDEGRRLENLSLKLMDLIVLGKQDFAFRSVPMDAFLEKTAKTMIPVLQQHNIRLLIQAEKQTMEIEPDLLKTACLNLLDNARKAIDSSGIIYLIGQKEGNGYCIQVLDNGKGIPPEDLKHITEAFYMVDKSRSRAQGGAGLGLAICERIITLHGGSIVFESVPDAGTKVSIHLVQMK